MESTPPLPLPAIRVQEQSAVATVGHIEAEMNQSDHAATQIMGFPAGLWHVLRAEKHSGDFAIARAGALSVHSAQALNEPVPACVRQRRRIPANRTAGECAPKRERRGGANIEELVEWNEHGQSPLAGGRCEDPVDLSPDLEGSLRPPTLLQGFERRHVEGESRIG